MLLPFFKRIDRLYGNKSKYDARMYYHVIPKDWERLWTRIHFVHHGMP